MILKAYAVHDRAADAYMRPFFESRHQMAMRMFGQAVQDQATEFFAHPQDYKLFCVGEFDDNKGMFKPQPPEFLCSAMEYINADTGRPSNNGDLFNPPTQDSDSASND